MGRKYLTDNYVKEQCSPQPTNANMLTQKYLNFQISKNEYQKTMKQIIEKNKYQYFPQLIPSYNTSYQYNSDYYQAEPTPTPSYVLDQKSIFHRNNFSSMMSDEPMTDYNENSTLNFDSNLFHNSGTDEAFTFESEYDDTGMSSNKRQGNMNFGDMDKGYDSDDSDISSPFPRKAKKISNKNENENDYSFETFIVNGKRKLEDAWKELTTDVDFIQQSKEKKIKYTNVSYQPQTPPISEPTQSRVSKLNNIRKELFPDSDRPIQFFKNWVYEQWQDYLEEEQNKVRSQIFNFKDAPQEDQLLKNLYTATKILQSFQDSGMSSNKREREADDAYEPLSNAYNERTAQPSEKYLLYDNSSSEQNISMVQDQQENNLQDLRDNIGDDNMEDSDAMKQAREDSKKRLERNEELETIVNMESAEQDSRDRNRREARDAYRAQKIAMQNDP